MPDVRVRQKYAIGRLATIQRRELRHHIRRCVKEIRASRPAIHETEARYALGLALPRSNRTAQLLLTPELRNAGILGDPKHDELPIGRRLVRGQAAPGC